MNAIEKAREKLKQMPMQEKISLAPRSTPELLELLLEDSYPQLVLAALDNPRMTEQRVFLFLQNAATPAEVIEKIARNRDWMKTVKMQIALIQNPHTPISLAMEYLPGLNIMDLVAIITSGGSMQPGLRQRMLDFFRQRVTQMGDEQRIQLLNRGSADIGQVIIDMGGNQVLSHAIKYGQLKQYQAIKIARSYQTSPQILTMLYETPPWGQQYEIKWSLLTNDNTPRDIKMRIFRSLSKSDQEKFKRENRAKAAGF